MEGGGEIQPTVRVIKENRDEILTGDADCPENAPVWASK